MGLIPKLKTPKSYKFSATTKKKKEKQTKI